MKRSRFNEFWLPTSDEHFANLLDLQRYQYDTFGMAMPYVGPPRVAIDAGAHVGIFSRRFAKFFQSVWAFEPDAENYACLLLNTKDLAHVKPIKAALGSEPGSCSMRVDAQANSGARGITLGGNIPVMTIDELDLTVSIIKIDTEGFEAQVIAGARKTLTRDRPVLIVERPPPETIADLRHMGYAQVGETAKDRIFAMQRT